MIHSCMELQQQIVALNIGGVHFPKVKAKNGFFFFFFNSLNPAPSLVPWQGRPIRGR